MHDRPRSEIEVSAGDESGALNQLVGRIGPLEVRATAGDVEAMNLGDEREGKEKYMLNLESGELREQAQQLRKRRTNWVASKMGDWTRTEHIRHFLAQDLKV